MAFLSFLCNRQPKLPEAISVWPNVHPSSFQNKTFYTRHSRQLALRQQFSREACCCQWCLQHINRLSRVLTWSEQVAADGHSRRRRPVNCQWTHEADVQTENDYHHYLVTQLAAMSLCPRPTRTYSPTHKRDIMQTNTNSQWSQNINMKDC